MIAKHGFCPTFNCQRKIAFSLVCFCFYFLVNLEKCWQYLNFLCIQISKAFSFAGDNYLWRIFLYFLQNCLNSNFQFSFFRVKPPSPPPTPTSDQYFLSTFSSFPSKLTLESWGIDLVLQIIMNGSWAN